jgi:hypothetical protein
MKIFLIIVLLSGAKIDAPMSNVGTCLSARNAIIASDLQIVSAGCVARDVYGGRL